MEILGIIIGILALIFMMGGLFIILFYDLYKCIEKYDTFMGPDNKIYKVLDKNVYGVQLSSTEGLISVDMIDFINNYEKL